MEKLELILHEVYGAPEDRLGNQVDPLDEAIYIILSIQTGLARFIETWRNLRAIFPSWSQVEEASVDAISDVLRSGGLHRQKAIAIQRLLRRVRNRFGTLSLDALYGMADSDAERFLLGLPGISWKTARCILLYSLGREVFPIDGNAFRILKRTGVIPETSAYRYLPMHNVIQAAIKPGLRRRFHVNLVIHGQVICLPKRPLCASCTFNDACPKRGLRQPKSKPRQGHMKVSGATRVVPELLSRRRGRIATLDARSRLVSAE